MYTTYTHYRRLQVHVQVKAVSLHILPKLIATLSFRIWFWGVHATIRNVHYAARFAMHVSHKIAFQLARQRYHSLTRTILLEYLHLQHPNICEYRWTDRFECYMAGTTLSPGQYWAN